jgi:dTDP-4-dehydrorhamnose 3,5-epimerase
MQIIPTAIDGAPLIAPEPDTQVLYKASEYNSAAHERGPLWNDPALGIEWPVGEREAILSDKDRRHPPLAELPVFFE